MNNTSIQWTDTTWNPVRGCSRVSEGCRNCYAEKMAARFSDEGMPYEGLATRHPSRWTGKVRLIEEHLNDPLKWTKPRRIFVNSMSDLFHEDISITHQTDIFEVMAKCPQHTFQILTKRAGLLFRMKQIGVGVAYRLGKQREPGFWPLPNVHIGVSVEDQKTADERIPLLLETPAAVRFISAEPLLGPIDARRFVAQRQPFFPPPIPRIDWVIVGGESGPGARPCDLAWIRSVVTQCKSAGVPVFVKQLGKRPYDTGFDNALKSDAVVHIGAKRAPHLQGFTTVHTPDGETQRIRYISLSDGKGGDITEWPEDLRVREFPTPLAVAAA